MDAVLLAFHGNFMVMKCIFLKIIFSLSILSCAFAHEPSPCAHLLHLSPKTYEYKGLTPQGLEFLKKERDILRRRAELFQKEFRNLDTLYHAGLLSRLKNKGHMFIYGPPGGAKSRFVNWMLEGEKEQPFKLQLQQMVTEQAFIGGQNYDALKEGRYEINTKGSLADYVIALIDEVEKGNPGALAVLLSLLNEGEIPIGKETIKARLETLYATSNANLPEFHQQFLETGHRTTAAALLNRFPFKAFVYNWLLPADMAVLDARNQRREYLKAISKIHPEVLQDEVFSKPENLEWSSLRGIAHGLFEYSPLFMSSFRELMENMRKETHKAVRESEENHKNNFQEEPFVYVPSAEYSERLRQQIPEIILMSAFIDFLMSPMADDGNLEKYVMNKTQLDPLSLWRSYLVLTTIGPGKSKLELPSETSDKQINVDFGWAIDASSASDTREERMIQTLQDEQARFRRVLSEKLTDIGVQIELKSRHAPKNSSESNSVSFSFEIQLQESYRK